MQPNRARKVLGGLGGFRTLPPVEISPETFSSFIDDFIEFNQITDYILTSMILSSPYPYLIYD